MSTTTITLTVELEPNVSGVDAVTIAELIEGMEHVYRVHVHEKRAKKRKQSAMRPHVRELRDRLRIGHFFIHELRRASNRDPVYVPVGCIALGYDPENNTMRVALSVCHDNDQFTKVKARDKARGRLLSFKEPRWFSFPGNTDAWAVMNQVWNRYGLRRKGPMSLGEQTEQLQHTWDLLTKKA